MDATRDEQNCFRMALDSVEGAISSTLQEDPRISCAVLLSHRWAGTPTKAILRRKSIEPAVAQFSRRQRRKVILTGPGGIGAWSSRRITLMSWNNTEGREVEPTEGRDAGPTKEPHAQSVEEGLEPLGATGRRWSGGPATNS